MMSACRWLVLAVLCLAQDASVLDLDARVPRMASPGRQLAHARRLKLARRGTAGAERRAQTEAAIEAYRAVREHFPWATRLSSEAAFRCGELLSASGRIPAAIDEFEFAVRSGAGTPFQARAAIAIGRLHRRNGDLDEARASLLGVVANPTTPRSRRDEAWLWLGRVYAEAGRPEDARTAWTEVTKHAADPLDRLRAYDFLGLSWLERDDPEAAAGVLNDCLQDLSGTALEATNQGARVRRALARMRLVTRLPRAIESRMRSRQFEGTPRKR